MRCWLKRLECAALAVPAIVSVALGACTGSDSGLEVRASRLERTAGQCHLSIRLAYDFPPPVLTALQNGVPITILVQARIQRPQAWPWASTVSFDARRFVLSQHTLTGQYLVQSSFDDQQQSLPNLEAALGMMQSINAWPLAPCPDPDSADLQYGVRARLALDDLPAPLRLTAMLSPAWRMDTGWIVEELP